MASQELTNLILEKLKKQIAFVGLTKRETSEGEVILKCPIVNGVGDLRFLAIDFANLIENYIAKMTLSQFKDWVKNNLI